jgi:phosphohistidine phosphatase
MNLYLIRHGKAELNSESGRDFDRPLTSKGKRKIEEISLRLSNLKIKIDKIYSSPYLRAKQTAEIIKHHILNECELEIINILSPGCTAQLLLENLKIQHENIALVGHEPDMSRMLSDLCGTVNVQFKKGGIAKIVFEGKPQIGTGILEFLITPKLLK